LGRGGDDQSGDDQSGDDQSDDDQKKFLRIGTIVLCVGLTLALGFDGVLPVLGAIILAGVKFARYFSKALKFGLGISFIAPLAITIFVVFTFYLRNIVRSKRIPQSPTGMPGQSDETMQGKIGQIMKSTREKFPEANGPAYQPMFPS
jgi:membrane-bound ClpP family serine protease